MPAGDNPDEELIEGMTWDESIIYLKALKKCSYDAIPALLKVRNPTPWILRKALAIGRYISATGSTATVGTVVGAVIGGAIGGGVGLLAGGIGVGLGGTDLCWYFCSRFGGLGTLDGGMEAHSEIRRYQKEQADLEKIQDGLQQIQLKKHKRKLPPLQWDGKDCPGKVKIRKRRRV